MDKNLIHTEDRTSDLLELLQNLQSMVVSYLTVARSQSQNYLLMALADEAEVLTRKTRRMHQRWNVYLPFHEVIDVKFEEWIHQIDEWLPLLTMQTNPLTNGFLLDLVREEPVAELKEELKKRVPEECTKVDRSLRGDLHEWEQKVYPEAFQSTTDERNAERTRLIQQAEDQLIALREELKGLEEFFSSELKEDQFKILALRLRHRDCKNALKEAEKEVARAHNSWPPKFVKQRAGIMKEEIKLNLLQDQKLTELKEYIELDDPDLYGEACFGRFIFKKRHELAVQDVQELVKKLETIVLLNEKYVDPNGSQRKREKAAAGRDLTDEEKQILKTLVQLTGKVEWRGGATADSIALGVKRMLGVGYTLDAKMQVLSDQLWKLLKSRKNCDTDKSLKVTWLNIVGWCVRQSLLSGGSPYLCKNFFPKCGPDDYKAIDKGKSDPAIAFTKVKPLLERFLK